MTSSDRGPLPSYKSPPVIEVSFGIHFEKLGGLQVRHFGQFWQSHLRNYPITEDAQPALPLFEDVQQRLVLMTLPPLRRMMAYSEDRVYVAQVQDSMFFYNWRKLDSERVYPRFGPIWKRFSELYSAFEKFVAAAKIGELHPTKYELTYVNHIELGTDVPKSLEEHVQLFRFSPIQTRYLSPPQSVNTTWRFDMPDDRGTATANLSNAKSAEGENILVLAFTCHGTPSKAYGMDAWFESGHEWIVRSFTELTTKKAHEKWERER